MNKPTVIERRPHAEWVQVTPEMAREWLAVNNDRNRSVRDPEVDRYAEDMKSPGDAWVQTGDTIKFSASGRLLDGQHRLLAIAASGRTVELLVVSGLTDTAQRAMDQGVKRTSGDSLALDGFEAPDLLASVAKLGHGLDTGKLFTRRSRTSTAQVRAWLDDNPDVLDAVRAVNNGGGSFRGGRLITPTVAAYALYRFTQVDAQAAALFMSQFGKGHNLNEGDPILALRNRLESASQNRERLSSRAAVSLMFRTWNHWRTGRTLQRISLTVKGEDAPTIPDLV